jgi:hypothetical protein
MDLQALQRISLRVILLQPQRYKSETRSIESRPVSLLSGLTEP